MSTAEQVSVVVVGAGPAGLAASAERRGVVIPIVFHFVLAAFLFVYGSWHLN